MKNIILVLILVLCLSSGSFAQMLLGARASGMGGVGVSTAYDMSSAYYNPACLMKAGNYGVQASIASAAKGIDQLFSSTSIAADPAKFIADNYGKALDINGTAKGFVGINANKVGITVIPSLALNIAKEKNTLGTTSTANGTYNGVLTLGTTYALMPGLPDLNLGLNLKYIGKSDGGASVDITGNGNETYSSSNGYGIDVGALMTFSVPAVTDIAVGLMARDVTGSITTANKGRTLAPDLSGQGFITGPEQDLGTTTTNADPTYVVGASGKIPVVGILLAADLETGKNTSNTHMGIEYPVAGNFAVLRAGVASGQNLSLTTFGAKLEIPVFTLNLAMVNDNKNSLNTQYVIDFGGTL